MTIKIKDQGFGFIGYILDNDKSVLWEVSGLTYDEAKIRARNEARKFMERSFQSRVRRNKRNFA